MAEYEQVMGRLRKLRYCFEVMIISLCCIYLLAGVMGLLLGFSNRLLMMKLTPYIEVHTSALIMVMITSVTLVLLGFLGCISVERFKPHFILAFLTGSLIACILCAVTTILIEFLREGIQIAPNNFNRLSEAFANYEVNKTWVDYTQSQYHCCGLFSDGYKFWRSKIPASCYKNPNLNSAWDTSNMHDHSVQNLSDVLYTKGCHKEIYNLINEKLFFVAIADYVSICAVFLGFMCSLFLTLLKYEEYVDREPDETIPEPRSTLRQVSHSSDPPIDPPIDLPINLPFDLPIEPPFDPPPNYFECISYTPPPSYDKLTFDIPEFNKIENEEFPPAYDEIDFTSPED